MATYKSRCGVQMNRRGWAHASVSAAAWAIAMAASSCLGQTCDGLVARWAFNGDATDATGNGHDGVLFGGSFASGKEGQAYQLVGGAYAEIADAPDLNPTTAITVSAWWFAMSFSGAGNDPILDKGYTSHSNPYYQYHLGVTGDTYWHTPGALTFDCTTNTGIHPVDAPAGTWHPGRWYHVAGTYDGSAVRIFVDGTL